MVRQLDVPEAGQLVHQHRALLDEGVEDVLQRKEEQTLRRRPARAWRQRAGRVLTWSASEVLSMLMSSFSAVSLHICSHPMLLRRSR